MKRGGAKLYRVHEFASLAGVTVRTLHHYDRVGLLKPNGRTQAGYRLYGERDLGRLDQIIVLKFLGLPLKQNPALLDGKVADLSGALRAQRRALEAQAAPVGREDPAGARAQALAERWRKLVEGFTGGDPQIQSGLNAMYQDRKNRPASQALQRGSAGLHDPSFKSATPELTRLTSPTPEMPRWRP